MASQQLYIPDAILAEWADLDYPVEAIGTWLEISEGIMKEVYSQLECKNEDNCAVIAYVADKEWEDMIANMKVNDRPVGIGQRGKLRQMLLAARKAMQSEPQPATAQASNATGAPDPIDIATATSAAVAAAMQKDDVNMVKLSDVALQGTDEKVKLVNLEVFREGRRTFKQSQGG